MDTSNDKVAELERRVEALERALNAHPAVVVRRTEKSISPKELLITRKPKSDVETTFFLAAYAELVEGVDSFTTDDIAKLYSVARLKLPANVNANINKNESKGLFRQADEKKDGKKAWTLTLSGETLFKG